jgi:SAM-dependent methyltransferase
LGRERDAAYWNDVIAGVSDGQSPTVWREHADRINADLCLRWWPAMLPSRVLKTDLFDEASGVGLWPTLVRRAGTVFGIDRAAATARLALAQYAGARMMVADVRRLPFRDGSFDLIVSNSTLDHFDRQWEIVASLRELARVTKPGGRLILTLDNPVNPVVALRNALPFSWLNRLGLVPYFVGATTGPVSGRRLLADAGFRALEIGAAMHSPRAPAVLMASLLSRIRWNGPRRALLRVLEHFETLRHWPTRYLTGYYVAFLAEKMSVPE